MTGESSTADLDSVALLHFHGPDAARFLQGQLSNDMTALNSERVLLAGLHNPQGRVLALLRLVAPAAGHVVALLPADLADSTATLLRRYVLRAKVTISVESGSAVPASAAAAMPALAAALRADARAVHIAAGLPQVYAATSGEFVAQMLNLDCIDAISFKKGCYTGQEIIARTHYRGRSKRRMQRFLTRAPLAAALQPGQAIALPDGRSARVVDGTLRADRCCDFLAVTTLPGESAPSDAAQAAPAGAAPTIDCTPSPLPYALPAQD